MDESFGRSFTACIRPRITKHPQASKRGIATRPMLLKHPIHAQINALIEAEGDSALLTPIQSRVYLGVTDRKFERLRKHLTPAVNAGKKGQKYRISNLKSLKK